MNQYKRGKDTFSIVRNITRAHPEWNARQIYDLYKILIGDTNKSVTLNAIQKQLEKIKEVTETDSYKELKYPLANGPTTKKEYNLSPEALFQNRSSSKFLCDHHPASSFG